MKKIIYITLGVISLGCAYVGLVMPFIPFTPFLLLTAFCFGKSSERLDSWFKNTKLYKDNFESLAKGQGMTKKAKIKTISTITALMGFGFIMMYGKAPTTAMIVLVLVWVAHIVCFALFVKTKEDLNDKQTTDKNIEG